MLRFRPLLRQFPAAGRNCGLEQLELSFQAGKPLRFDICDETQS